MAYPSHFASPIFPSHFASPIFDSTRIASLKFMAKFQKEPADHVFHFTGDLNLPQQQRLVVVVSEAKDLSTFLEREFTNALRIIFPHGTIPVDSIDAATVLEALKVLVNSMLYFSNGSLELFGRKASEFLAEITVQIQQLEKELDEAKASGKACNSIFPPFVGAIAALACPVAKLFVAPFFSCLDLAWNCLRLRPIENKLNDLRAIKFEIHSAILEAGKIQDAVYSVSNIFTDPPSYARKDHINFDDDINKDQELRYLPLPGANNSIDFKAKVNDSSAFKGKGVIGLPSVVSGDIKLKGVLEKAAFNLVPSSSEEKEEEEDIGDGTKRLFEVGKAMVAAKAQVKMAQHELSQIIRFVTSSL